MILRRTALALTMALVLNACGGSDGATPQTGGNTGGTGNSGGSNPPPAPTPESGVFVDSPVAGIQYQTATQSGETNAEGRFSYLPGETVTFSIGGVTLPAVQATGTVTPLTLFGTSDLTDQRVVNLGRLLQSLDDDGDLENGIQIASAAHSAATGTTLDFNVSVTAFEAQTGLINLLANGGGSATLISADDAIAHMQEQLSQRGLSLTGTWYIEEEDYLVTVTFLANGSYILAEAGEADDAGSPGVEYGTYHWDPVTGSLTAEVLVDTNGEWGVSHPQGQMTLTLNGNEATFSESGDSEGATVLQRLIADPDTIVGTWVVDDQEEGDLSIFAFLPSGYFALAEIGAADDAGSPGVEAGTYVWSAANSTFSADILVNTNGEWGISDEGIATVEVDGGSMVAITELSEMFTLTRLP